MDSEIQNTLEKISDYRNDGNLIDAVLLLNELLSKIPESIELLCLEAELKIEMGFWDDAKILLLELLLDNPDNSKILNNLGTIYWNENKTEKAVSYFEKAYRYDPINSSIVLNLADIYLSQNKTRQARKILEKYIRFYPDDLEASEIYEKIKQNSKINNNSNPLVSIIIPTLAVRIESLITAINSVLDQTYENIEIIIINDGGLDISNILNNNFNDERIVYISHDINRDRSAARNTGIIAAKGKYIAYLDDDDRYYNNHIETLVEFLENSDYKIAYTDAYRCLEEWDNGKYIVSERELLQSQDFDYDKIFVENFIPILCLMHAKSCVGVVGLFDENLKTNEDQDLLIRLSRKYKIAHIPEITAEYSLREDGSNTTVSRRELVLDSLNQIYNKYKDYTQNKIEIINQQEEKLVSLKTNLENTKKSKENISLEAANKIQRQEIKSHTNLRILMTMYGWNESGGGTTFPKSVAKHLRKLGYEVAVFYATAAHSTNKTPYYLDSKEEDGVKLFGVYNRASGFLDSENPQREIKDIRILNLFNFIIDEFQPDIIHFHNFLGLSFGLAEIAHSRNIPSLYTPYNYHLIDPNLYMFKGDLTCWNSTDFNENSELAKNHPELFSDYQARKNAALDLLNNKLKFTLAVSNRVRDILIEFGANSNKIAVLNQVHDSIDSILEANIQTKELHKPIRFGYIGGVMPHKGVHLIVQAAQFLPKNSCEILIYGFYTPQYAKILLENDKSGMVKLMGEYSSSDFPKISSELDVVILPSLWEDCAPFAITESLAMKLPVIAPNIGGFPDFIIDNFNGRLYKHDSLEQLYFIMMEIITDTELILKWQKNCNINLTIHDHIKSLSNIYNKILDNKRLNIKEISQFFLEDNFINNLSEEEEYIEENQEYSDESDDYLEILFENKKSEDNSIKSDNISDILIEEKTMNRKSVDYSNISGFSKKEASGKLPDLLPNYLKLNLGCGLDVRDDYINIDLYSENPKVIRMDIRQLEFPDNSADEILASDVLEHFSHRETLNLLKEWNRVLKPNGILELRLPSLKLQAKAYLSGAWNADIASYMIFGGQTNPGDYHSAGFDTDTIRNYLENSDFIIENIFEQDIPQDRGYINLNMIIRAKKIISENLSKNHSQEYIFKENNEIYTENKNESDIFDSSNLIIKKNSNKSKYKLERKEKPYLNIIWEGSQFVWHSLALINRNQCLNIINSGLAELTIVPYELDVFSPKNNPDFVKLEAHDIRFKENIDNEFSKLPYLWIRHQWPPNPNPPAGSRWVIIQPWEFTRLRKDFVEIFKQADEIWVPSNFNRNSFIESGLDSNKVHIVPNGINPEIFKPTGHKYNLKTKKDFQFLYVGGTIYRKGIDILLQAYLKVFTKKDNICLVIKDMGGDTFYKGQTAQDYIESIMKNPDCPEIEYIKSYLSEEEMANLYRSCNVFVSSYRGEGFSLPTLEAMACGLPVVVTKGGATDDFCDEEVAWLIPSELKSVGTNIDSYELTEEAFLLEPDMTTLALTLRKIYEEPGQVFSAGLLAQFRARVNWTWREASMKMFSRIDSMYDSNLTQEADKILEKFTDETIRLAKAEKLFIEEKFDDAYVIFSDLMLSENLADKHIIHSINRLVQILIINKDLETAENLLIISGNKCEHAPDTKYLKSRIFALQGKNTDAMELLQEVLDKWKENKFQSTLGLNLEILLSDTGDLLLNDGDIDSAYQVFTEINKLNSKNTEALIGLAQCCIMNNEKQEAKKYLNKILELDPKNKIALNYLNMIL